MQAEIEAKEKENSLLFEQKMREQMGEKKRELEKRKAEQLEEERKKKEEEDIAMAGKAAKDLDLSQKGASLIKESREKFIAKKAKLTNTERQKKISEKLATFRMSLKTNGKEDKEEDIEEDVITENVDINDDDEKGWKSHRLVFEKPELEKCVIDPMLKQEEEYVIYDPLKDNALPSSNTSNYSRHNQRLGWGKSEKKNGSNYTYITYNKYLINYYQKYSEKYTSFTQNFWREN